LIPFINFGHRFAVGGGYRENRDPTVLSNFDTSDHVTGSLDRLDRRRYIPLPKG